MNQELPFASCLPTTRCCCAKHWQPPLPRQASRSWDRPPSPTIEGLEAARQIRADHPGTAILVLSQYVETRYAIDLLRDDPSGVGYLLKDRVTRLADLADAVRRVAEGGSVTSGATPHWTSSPAANGRSSSSWPRADRTRRSRNGSSSSSRPWRATSGRSSPSSAWSRPARTTVGSSRSLPTSEAEGRPAESRRAYAANSSGGSPTG